VRAISGDSPTKSKEAEPATSSSLVFVLIRRRPKTNAKSNISCLQ
jgi:hypothetical protein